MAASGPLPQGDGGLRITRLASRPGLILAGEIDDDTRTALVAELGRLTGASQIHLYLAGIIYCDLAGLRTLLGLGAAGPEGAPRQVVLHDLPPWLHRIMAVVGWDASPGVVIS